MAANLTHSSRCVLLFGAMLLSLSVSVDAAAEPSGHLNISGVYPHLAYWNPHGECGTGAVVPWADNLWVITYGPHFPQGSQDKLYKISPELEIEAFDGSVGGTPANRFLHRESNQLIIGPYFIDQQGGVRVVPPSKMYGRLTGTARHLFEPEKKVYFATMEEGIYEVDVETLEVTEFFQDDQVYDEDVVGSRDFNGSRKLLAGLPGYHGKGLYSGQGRLIYANNGEFSEAARRRPDVPSGCLAEWDGKSDNWKVIRRNQFTDIRGPGGLYGNPNPETDPVWAIGWDHRSLLLMLLDDGEWHTYRLPKATHTYDGAHGWNTEWPRIHDIGQPEMVMNMHGMFWKFPKTFSRDNSAGILPRSTYLKVIGDYCMWDGKLVFGCDDTAKTEFLNKRRSKGSLKGPGKSHSNLWFTDPAILDQLGPQLGRGAVWSSDDVQAGAPSDPYLFSGFPRRVVHVKHETGAPVTFTLEVDRRGDNQWETLEQITVPAESYTWRSIPENETGAWVRVTTDKACQGATVQFSYSEPDHRGASPDPMFQGLAKADSKDVSGGIVRVRTGNLHTLGFAATQTTPGGETKPAFYELDADMKLKKVNSPKGLAVSYSDYGIPKDILTHDAASLIYVDDDGNPWRLPRGYEGCENDGLLGAERVDREVVTERDLFNCGGLFYELPARNAGGFARIRPICTHNTKVKDYCSYRGLLIFSGVDADAPEDNEHILRSDDGRVALWAGVIDDLWKFGRPTGFGGPWLDSPVAAGEPSAPYLMTGFEKKSVTLSHQSAGEVSITLQVDIDGAGTWVDYKTFTVAANEAKQASLPDDYSAYWVRAVADQDCTATVQFRYE